MRRSQCLLTIVVVLVGARAFAQEPLSPYAEEPAPMAPAPPPQMAVPPPMAAPPVPPPIVAPPPQPYAQPYYYQYQAQPYYAAPAPRMFHEELRPNYGLMVAGIVLVGATWSINAASAYLANEWKLAVPLVGPFMETQNINTDSNHPENRMVVGALVFDGLIECAGAIMLVAGAVTHHKVRIYDGPRFSLVPTGTGIKATF